MVHVQFQYNFQTQMYDFVVCGIFKNEGHILSEWIQHYLLRGVDHIYLVNDCSDDDFLPSIRPFCGRVTLFENDIFTREVGRQAKIYEKYFRPILSTSKYAAILDLDEFLYSPDTHGAASGHSTAYTSSPVVSSFSEILKSLEPFSQIKVDWLHFGSNGHMLQPVSVVSGFTARAAFTTDSTFYSFKTIFKTADLISFGIHEHRVRSNTVHLRYSDAVPPVLVINHYNLQSYDFYTKIKCTRGDVNNWFDSINKKRDDELFRAYDKNEVSDLRLLAQNTGKIDLTVGSEDDDVTLVITSCNRPELLSQTLESFVANNTYPISKTLLIDDSGIAGCNESAIEPYKEHLRICSIYNPVNIGQVSSIDKAYSYVRTKWIFHCEEDWRFLRPGFIEKSMRVFNDNPSEKIFTVWLRPHSCTSKHPIIKDTLGKGYYSMKPDFSYTDRGTRYTWCGVSFNPGLRKTSDCQLFHPYSFCCRKQEHEHEHVGEYDVNAAYMARGYTAKILSEQEGHVTHIGWHAHIPRPYDK